MSEHNLNKAILDGLVEHKNLLNYAYEIAQECVNEANTALERRDLQQWSILLKNKKFVQIGSNIIDQTRWHPAIDGRLIPGKESILIWVNSNNVESLYTVHTTTPNFSSLTSADALKLKILEKMDYILLRSDSSMTNEEVEFAYESFSRK